MTKICMGCRKEFNAGTKFISFCNNCLNNKVFRKEDETEFLKSCDERYDFQMQNAEFGDE